jgi:hypothetical protein
MKRTAYPWIKWGARLSLAGGLLAGLNLIYVANCVWPYIHLYCAGPNGATPQQHLIYHVGCYVGSLPSIDLLGVDTIDEAKSNGLWQGAYGPPGPKELGSWWHR